jgi:hypothetical protein
MVDSAYLDTYEHLLEDGLLKLCRGAGLLEGEVLGSPDLEAEWNGYIRDYTADAVENFNSYPEASLSWAAFLGLGVAHNWDSDWGIYRDAPYSSYYGSRGWDDMDEHILRDVLRLPLDSPEARKISDTLLSCALATLGLIRHEGIETQTELGFYILTRSYTVLFRIGAAIELKRLGYRNVRVR